MNSAKQLLGFDFDADRFARNAPHIEISQQTLVDLKKIEERHGDERLAVLNPEDLRQIYRRFINANRTGRLHTEFNTLSRVRKLAWGLIYSENNPPFNQRIVDDRQQLQSALGLIENRFSISALIGVFDALLQAWDTQNAWMLRKFLKKHLIGYKGRRKFVQKLKTNMVYYCAENSATQLAMELLRESKKLSAVWASLELPEHTYGYQYFGVVAEEYVSRTHHLDQEDVADIVEFVKKHKDDKTVRAVLSKIIEKLGFDASQDLRQPVQSYALQNWGDPRIAGGQIGWHDISNEAKQIFTRWITKEDLRFFFDVVAQACNDQKFAYRKAFWLAYLEHISFCRPVLRQNAEYLFRSDAYYQEQKQNIALLNGGGSDQHAFIIQVGDYTFVEFSTKAACYVYDNSRLPFRLNNSEYTMDTWAKNTLRDQSLAEDRVIHHYSENYSWQEKLASWIKRELGIEPLRSYRLENPDNSETDHIAKLIQDLGNTRIWLESSQALVKIGKPAVPALTEALHDQDHRIRNRVIHTLGKLGKTAWQAIPTLQKLRLSDPKDYIRSQAASVLKRIDPLSQFNQLQSNL